jgi:hypothetical protein
VQARVSSSENDPADILKDISQTVSPAVRLGPNEKFIADNNDVKLARNSGSTTQAVRIYSQDKPRPVETILTDRLIVSCRDMPPSGGFEAIRYKRSLPIRGPGGAAIFGGITAICAYGFYLVGKGNLERR